MNIDQGLSRKCERLITLLATGNVEEKFIRAEIATLRQDILGSGHTEADIDARTNPRAFRLRLHPNPREIGERAMATAENYKGTPEAPPKATHTPPGYRKQHHTGHADGAGDQSRIETGPPKK